MIWGFSGAGRCKLNMRQETTNLSTYADEIFTEMVGNPDSQQREQTTHGGWFQTVPDHTCYFTGVINSVISTGRGYRLLQCRVWSPDRISLLSEHLLCACSVCFFHAPALKEIPKAKKSYVQAYQILLHFTLLHCTDSACFTN